MSGLFGILTPHRNANQTQDQSTSITFDEVESFREPAPKDRQRMPLAVRSENLQRNAEFTPILRTATKKATFADFTSPRDRSHVNEGMSIENSALTPASWRQKSGALDRDNLSTASLSQASPTQSMQNNGVAGIREQEKVTDKLKKENFELKLKIYMMEQDKYQTSPEHVQKALRENIDYKVQITSLSKDIARYKRSLIETERKVASLGDQVSASISLEECRLPHTTSEEQRAIVEQLEVEREALTHDKEDLEMQVRELERECDDLRASQDEVKDLQVQLTAAEGKINSLEDDLEAASRECDDLRFQAQSNDDNEKLVIMTRQLEDKEHRIASLVAQMREQEGASAATQTHVARLMEVEQRNDSLEAEVEACKEAIETLQNKIESLEVRKGELELQVISLNNESSNLRSTIEQQIRQIASLQDELQERQEDIEEFKGAADDQSFEYRQLEQKLEELQLARSEASKREISELKNDHSDRMDALEKEVSELQMAAREAERDAQHRESQILRLEHAKKAAGKLFDLSLLSSLKEVEIRSREQETLVAELQDRLRAQNGKIQAHEREAQSLQERLAAIARQKAMLEEQVKVLETTDDVDSTQIQDRFKEEICELREKVDFLESQIAEKDEEINYLTDEAAEVGSELDSLKISAEGLSSELKVTTQTLETTRIQITDLERQLHSSRDQKILLENTREKLQTDLANVRQCNREQSEKITALNTSLLNVRSMLSESQQNHKTELLAITNAGKKEKADLAVQCAELKAQMNDQSSAHEKTLKDIRSAREELERKLSEQSAQISSLEQSIKRFGDDDENPNYDSTRFQTLLESETQRYREQEGALRTKVESLERGRQELEAELSNISASLTSVRSELRSMTLSDHSKSQELSTLEMELQQLRAELADETSRSASASLARQEAQAKIASLEGQITTLQESLSTTRREHQTQWLSTSDELFASAKHARELTERLNHSEARTQQFEQEKERLSAALTAAEQRVLASIDNAQLLLDEKLSLEARLEQYTNGPEATDVVETEKSQLRAALLKSEDALRQAQSEIEELAFERDQLRGQVEELSEANKRQMSHTAATIRSLNADLQKTQAFLIQETEKANRIEADSAEALRQETAKARVEHTRLTHLVADLEESLQVTKQKHTDLLACVGSADDGVESLTRRIRELESDIRTLKHDSANERREDLSQTVDQLEGQIEDLVDQLNQKDRHTSTQKVEQETRLRRLEEDHADELARMEEDRECLLSDLQEAQYDRDNLKKRAAQLEATIKDHTHTIRQLEAQIASKITEDVGHVNNRKQDVRDREKDDLKRQLMAAKNEAETLRSATSNGKLYEARLTKDMANAERKIKSLEAEITQREKKINQLKAFAKEKGELLFEAEKRQRALEAQYGSKHSNDRAQKTHMNEIAGLTRMMKHMHARTSREESFRSDLSYIKMFYDKQIAAFRECNELNLAIIQQIGIYPDNSYRARRLTLKTVGQAVIATIRMKNRARVWAVEKVEKSKIERALRNRR